MATTVTKIVDPNGGTGHDYDSLIDWEAAQQGDLTGARDEIAVAKCRCTGGTADDGVYLAGWTMSSTQYVKIWTDPAESYRHAGTYPTGNKYRIEGVTYAHGISHEGAANYFLVIDGIAIKSKYDDWAYAIYSNNGGTGRTGQIVVTNCVIRGQEASCLEGNIGIEVEWSIGVIAVNNIIYGFTNPTSNLGIGANTTGTSYIANNTISNCRIGVQKDASDAHPIINNIFHNCTTDAEGADGDDTYNSTTNDNTKGLTPAGTGNKFSQTFSFVDATNKDFHLNRGDNGAAGYGTDISGNSTFPFSTDIDGNTRTGAPWSIGADQLSERVYVVDPNTGSGYDYDSLYDWEAGRQGALLVRETAKCRCTNGTADGADWVTIDGWTVAPTKNVKIWTDPTESYRHSGTYPTGNKYRFEPTTTGDYSRPIYVIEQYTQIIGLACKLNASHSQCAVIETGATDIYIDSCIFKGNVTGGSNLAIYGVSSCQQGTKISNCIAYDFISGTGASKGFLVGYNWNSASSWLYNCTVHNCQVGFGDYGGGSAVCKNCIAQDCTNGFDGIHDGDSRNNVSDLATDAPGTNSRSSTTVTFVDEGGDDFHLASNDSGALGYGLNLYNDSNIPFQHDIDGQDRGGVSATWDVGADEYISAAIALDQEGFRFRNDDGSETTATWKEAQDTNINLAINTVARLRMLINATGDPDSKQFRLEYRRKPSGGAFGSWLRVP